MDALGTTSKIKVFRLNTVLFGNAFELLLERKAKSQRPIKKSTEAQYRYSYKTDLQQWANKPLIEITPEDAESLYRERLKTSKSRANMAFRLIKMVFRFAKTVYFNDQDQPILLKSPADKIASLKLQQKLDPRTSYIRNDQLNLWFEAVKETCTPIVSDLLVFTLLSGFRKNEAAMLTWDQVDIENEVLTLNQNSSKSSIQIPMSSYITVLLKKRKESVDAKGYVFPAGRKSGFLKDWRKTCTKVTSISAIKFVPQDLHRTFKNIAISLDIDPYAISILVDHCLPNKKVTVRHMGLDFDDLRDQMQKITDTILDYAGVIKACDSLDEEEIFLVLDRLVGIELEVALNRLPKAQQDRYLTG